MERAGKIGLLLPAGPGSFYPLWNYWTARFDQAVSSGREAADRARRENNVPMMMEALPHFAVSLAANGEYAEALSIYAEARTVGQRYGVMAPLARVIAMEAGMHLDILDFAGAEAIQNEAREQAAAASFPPAAVSAGIDLLLNLARQGKPERAEALEPDIAAAVEREAGWHGWLWRLRLAQAHAELAVARGDWNQALEHAEDSIQRSIASGRVKYQVAALGARAAARAALGREDDAITDLRRGVDLARASGDPAMLLRALLPLAARRPDEDVTKEARAVRDRIAAALPESMRPAFLAAQPLAALS
jgi:tetratricopeptide (TPR) repeat protein